MARLKRDDWYDTYRDTEWTFSYVDRDAVFPEELSGGGNVPPDDWKHWDEPFKVTYPEYVATQREKESGAYAVKSAMKRSGVFARLDEGWKSAAKIHFGVTTGAEFMAGVGELRMARFALSPAWRDMAVFGMLDEIRHTQLDLVFAHEFIDRDSQFDWGQKAYHTNNLVSVASRGAFDSFMANPGAVDVAIQLPFTFETGFTNISFVALASNALASGDVSFANMISSGQTDEARHAQQGHPTIEILMKHDPKRAQWLVDKTFWMAARLFSFAMGSQMDYYAPIAQRKQSYKEFLEEWLVSQYAKQLDEFGLKKPWFWQEFVDGLDTWTHACALGIWYYRRATYWRPQAGVSRRERKWLVEKYPKWEQQFGPTWDLIIENLANGEEHKTHPQTLPWLCNCCQLPIGSAAAPNDPRSPVRSYPLTHAGQSYHFCSKPCRQIWWEDKDMLNQKTIVERVIAGEAGGDSVEAVMAFMGMDAADQGSDAYNYAWVDEYRQVPPVSKAA